MYKHCYFYIESGYMNVSAAQQEKFYDEILSDVIKSIYVYNDKRIKIVWNFKERLVENVICEEKETSA